MRVEIFLRSKGASQDIAFAVGHCKTCEKETHPQDDFEKRPNNTISFSIWTLISISPLKTKEALRRRPPNHVRKVPWFPQLEEQICSNGQ